MPKAAVCTLLEHLSEEKFGTFPLHIKDVIGDHGEVQHVFSELIWRSNRSPG